MSQTKRITQNNFSLGELSPRTYGRHDQPWFTAGCRIMENFIALPQGPAEARPGTIREFNLPDDSKTFRIGSLITKELRIVLFLLEETMIYFYEIVEIDGNITITEIMDNQTDPVAITISVDYTGIPMRDIQILIHDSKVYLAHPKKQTLIISFELTSGTITLDYFAPLYSQFRTDDLSSYKQNDVLEYEGMQYMAKKDAPTDPPKKEIENYKIIAYFPYMIYSTDIPIYISGTYVKGDMCLKDDALWVVGERLLGGTLIEWDAGGSSGADQTVAYAYYSKDIPYTKILLRQFIPGGKAYSYQPNFDSCDNTLIVTRIDKNGDGLEDNRPPSPGTDLEWIKAVDLRPGISVIKKYNTSSSGYSMGEYIHYNGYLIQIAISTAANPPVPFVGTYQNWTKVGDAPTFLEEGEYPNTILFHDGRFWIFGTENNPNACYASKVREYDGFTMGANDGDSIQLNLQLGGSRQITWASSKDGILVGTEKSEILISGEGGPITPSNVQSFPQSRSGSMRNGIANVGSATCFFQVGGYRLLRFVFSNDTQAYETPDMGMLGEHLLSIGVKEFALQTNPDFILWCIMDDGSMLGGTYLPDQQIFGWHRHTTDGHFESVEVTRGESEDIIWLIVKRPIRNSSGETTGYIKQLERFAARRQAHDEKMVYMDDAEILTIADSKATVSESKRGQTLTVIQGGAPHQNVTADETTGEISLQYEMDDEAFNTCVIGRAYTPKLSPQKIIPGGSTLNISERISAVSVRFLKSLGLYVGIENSDIDPLPVREGTGNYGEVVEPFTGEEQLEVNDTFDGDGWLMIERKQPFPATILFVSYDLELGGF